MTKGGIKGRADGPADLPPRAPPGSWWPPAPRPCDGASLTSP
jgi:hypothetical protein